MTQPRPFDAQRALTLAAQTFEIEARALRMAARTFEIEARALDALAARLGEGFSEAVRVVLACRGRVVVMGMGKSGHVGRKIAAFMPRPRPWACSSSAGGKVSAGVIAERPSNTIEAF